MTKVTPEQAAQALEAIGVEVQGMTPDKHEEVLKFPASRAISRIERLNSCQRSHTSWNSGFCRPGARKVSSTSSGVMLFSSAIFSSSLARCFPRGLPLSSS